MLLLSLELKNFFLQLQHTMVTIKVVDTWSYVILELIELRTERFYDRETIRHDVESTTLGTAPHTRKMFATCFQACLFSFVYSTTFTNCTFLLRVFFWSV